MSYYLERCPKCGKLRPAIPPHTEWDIIDTDNVSSSMRECEGENGE